MTRKILLVLFSALVLFCSAQSAHAQTLVLNPTQYSFSVVPFYDETFADGTKKVVSIATDFYDGTNLALSLNSGHPVKDAANLVTVQITRGVLLLDKQYTIVVRYVNAFTSTSSDPSVPVMWSSTTPPKPGRPVPCAPPVPGQACPQGGA